MTDFLFGTWLPSLGIVVSTTFVLFFLMLLMRCGLDLYGEMCEKFRRGTNR